MVEKAPNPELPHLEWGVEYLDARHPGTTMVLAAHQLDSENDNYFRFFTPALRLEEAKGRLLEYAGHFIPMADTDWTLAMFTEDPAITEEPMLVDVNSVGLEELKSLVPEDLQIDIERAAREYIVQLELMMCVSRYRRLTNVTKRINEMYVLQRIVYAHTFPLADERHRKSWPEIS